MKWHRQMIYDLLPEGVYIRCCRVVYDTPRRRGRPGLPNGYNVLLLRLRRAKHKKALVVEHEDFFLGCPVFSSEKAEEEAELLDRRFAFYLLSAKLDERAALALLHSPYLFNYIGFDPGVRRPHESVEDTMARLVPKEILGNIMALTEMMI